MPDTFIPYRDRPALDKGPKISWTELESGMLFEPLAGTPSLRRVRGFPQFIWEGEFHAPSFLIGSEDAKDGRPCGGVIACGAEFYVRRYLNDGRPVYTSSLDIGVSNKDTIERLRKEFTKLIDELDRAGDRESLRMSTARKSLRTLTEGPTR